MMPAVTPRVSLPDRFEIRSHVANGGMASVWAAAARGLGRAVAARLPAGGQGLGTASYRAPEQVRGEAATPASDIYSLGVGAHRLLTGRRPFSALNSAAQARAHVDEDPPPASASNPDLPAAVDGVLRRALAKDPAARWPSATAFVDALQRALGPDEPTAPTRA